MTSPTRFTSGISTQFPKSVLNSLPTLPASNQQYLAQDFFPYRSTDWTLTQTNGAAAVFGWNNGAVQLSTTTAAADKAVLGLVSSGAQVIPGNQLWFSATIAVAASGQADATATQIYAGLFDTVDPTASANGLFFIKSTNNSSAVDFAIRKNGTTTRIQNVADLAKPSGIYGDTRSTAGTLTTQGAAGAYTSVAVANAGSGYAVAPLVLATGATGSGAQIYTQLGSGSLYAPYLTAAGSAYTTYLNEVNPWITLQFYYDGKQTLTIGVNGKVVASVGVNTVGPIAGTAITPGQNYNNATVGPIFNTQGTQLSTSVSPVQPLVGSFYNVAPQVPLRPGVGIGSAGGAGRAMYVDSVVVGQEYN
jgi:hypothetical protein